MPAKENKNNKFRFLRRFLRVFSGILVFLFLVILFIRSPWGQNIIINQATNYISNKTNTKVEIDRAFLTFQGNLEIDGLFLEDKKGDTLLYSRSLEANLPILGLIRGTTLGVENLKWKGVRANIIRKDTLSGYNFQFLIDAFVSQETQDVDKDTTATSPNIVIGDLDLSNFYIKYYDIPLGIESTYKIGHLETSMKTLDVEKMIFETNDILLSDANIKYVQKTSSVKSSKESSLPNLFAEKILVKNTKFFYEDTSSTTLADLDIDSFTSNKVRLNLENTTYLVDNISLQNSKILVESKRKSTNKNNTNTHFLWPEIELKINTIDFQNNIINYFVNNVKVKKNVFNPNAIALSNLTLKANTVSYKDKKGNLEIDEFSFIEGSGLNLNELKFKASISDDKMALHNFYISLNKNIIDGSFNLNYSSISDLLDSPEKTDIALEIPVLNLNLSELLKFKPELKSNLYLKEITKKPIKGSLFAKGTLKEAAITNSKISWGKTTKIFVDGSIVNLINPTLLELNLPNFKVSTIRKDLLKFIDEEALGIKLPRELSLKGKIDGTINDISTDFELNSPQGAIAVKGNFKNITQIDFNADIDIKNYKINELLQNEQLGEVSMNLNTKGSGKTLNNLSAHLDATVSKFKLNNYSINDLTLEGNLKNGKGELNSSYKDDNLNINLKSLVDLDTINTTVALNLNVIGADLQGLGFMKRNVKTGMDISANFKGNLDKYNIDANVKDGVVVYDNKTFLLGKITAEGYINKDTTVVSLNNKMINLKLESNTDPKSFSTSLKKHISSYFKKDVALTDTIKNPVRINFEAKIAQTPLLENVFLVNLKDIDTIAVSLDFNEEKRKLDTKILAPHINYSGNELDSLAFTMNTDKDSFNFKLGFNKIDANPFYIPKTIITGNQVDNELALNFAGYYNEKKLMNVNGKITGNRERLLFSINPENLILNKEKWNIPENNEIILTDNNLLSFQNFKINKAKQSIEITNKLENIKNTHVALEYKDFKISEVFNYLNPEIEIASGVLNGNFVLEDPLNNTGIIANLNVDNFKILKTDLGKLTLEAKSLGASKYDFNAKLKEGDIDLDVTGDYFVVNQDANLNVNLQLNEFKMQALNTLSLGEIQNTNGNFSGNLKVTGTTSKPVYNGDLSFNNADFEITKLNTKFTLKNEKLSIDNEGLYFSKFTIFDANNNKLNVSGKIKTQSFTNPKFDLQLRAKNFRLLNAKKEDNPSLYGLVTFNANADLTGDLQIPKLSANVTLGSDTNVTYVLPPTYAGIEERDGVVVFVNRENPDAILTQTNEQKAIITGFDILTKFKVDKKAVVTVVLDEDTGDNFRVSGDGEFIFNMKPNGRLTLTGTYEIVDGHYELNLYGLVNRKFNLAPGGTISWSGDPFEASLDISAIYNLETSAAPLMASQVSDNDPSVKNRFKQVLPFGVYLNIDGEILKPNISFNLDMPEDKQGAIGGQVYGRVQQVNQQKGELNKQVFSLLVLNRFYPDYGSDGSSGGFATIARDNLNDAVSGQLNAFSDKILGKSGIELDFDLNSYTDYQSNTAADRTQLGVTAQKKLFNERLTIRVGSNVDLEGGSQAGEQTPIIGNVSIEYKISKNGRYRLRGFRRSEFENIIDGQTIISGVALIFSQEFNEYRELWNAIFRKQKEKAEKEQELSEKKIEEKEEKIDNSLEKNKN